MVEEKDPLDEYIERIGSISLDAMHVTSEVRVVLYRVRTRLRSLEQRALDAAPAEAKRLSALEDAVTGLDGWRTTERNDSGMMQMTIHDGPPHLRGANNDHSNIDNEPGSGQSREGDDSGHEKDDGPQGNRRQRNAETGGDSGLLDSPIARPVSGGDESDRGRLTAVQPIDAAPAPAEWAPRDWYPADAKRTWAAMSLEERRRVIGNAAPAPAAAPSSPPTIALCEACGAAVLPHLRKVEPVNVELLAAVKEFHDFAVNGRRMMSAGDWMLLGERLTATISAAEAAPTSRSPAEERGALERLRDLAAGLVPGFDVEGDYAEAARSVAMQLGVAIDVELAKLGADERPIDWEARAKKAEAFVASICDAADGPRPNEEQVRIAREASAPPGRVQENPGLLDAALAAFDKEIAFVGDDPGDSAESASYADGVRWAKARLLVLAKEQPPVPVVETAKLARAFADGVASVDVKAAMVAAVKRCCFLIFNASGEEDVETKLVADINAGAWYPQLQADIEAGRDPLISSEKEAVAQVERERSLMIAAVDEVLARARKDVFYRGADDVTLQDVVAHLSVDIDSGAFVPDLPEPAAVAPPIPEVELTDECEAEMVANAAVVTTMSKSMSKRLAVQRGEPTPTFDDRSVPLGDGGTPVSPPEREDGRERSLHRPSGMGGPEHRRQSAGPCDREGLIDRRTNAAAEPAPSPAEMVANAEVVTSMRWRAAADDVLAAEQLAYDGDLTPERFVRLMRSPKVGLDATVVELVEAANRAARWFAATELGDDIPGQLIAAVAKVSGAAAPPCPECAGSGVGVHGCDCPCGAARGRTWRLTVHDGPGGRFAHAFAAFGTPIIRLGGTCLDGLTEVEVTVRGVKPTADAGKETT